MVVNRRRSHAGRRLHVPFRRLTSDKLKETLLPETRREHALAPRVALGRASIRKVPAQSTQGWKEPDMLKTIIAATAISALASTSVLAQTTPTASPTTPSATAPAPGATEANFVARQSPDQWLASKFRGTDVVGTNEEKIGDVDDVLFDKDGKIVAYVVGVGGFLGIGSKDVALAPASFQVVPGKDPSDYKLRLAMTKEQLKAAAAFEPYAPPRPTAQNPASPMAPTRPISKQ
jgi:hypothetical protein